jgi:hypothetical protein
LVFSLDHFAFAAFHSSVVQFPTSATVEATVLGAAVVDGEFAGGGEGGVCATAIPTQMNPVRATMDRRAKV